MGCTVIIPQKGKRELTNRLVRQIRSFESNFARIIIVDDDDDPKRPECQAEFVLSKGRGWTAAINTGLDMCDAGASVLLLNNDVECMGPFIRHFASPNSHMCLLGAKMRLEDKLGSKSQQILPMSNWLEGWCLWIPPEVRSLVGTFDENLKMYFSDLDYQMRAHKARVRIFPVLTAPFTHMGKATAGSIPNIKTMWERDREAFIRKWENPQ